MFDVVSFCTESYQDILKFSLPPMIEKADCDKIIIYTDGMVGGKWDVVNPFKVVDKIDFRLDYEPSHDWHTWALRKPDMLKRYLESAKEGTKFLLTDLDCLCMGSWRDALNGEFWIKPIRWDKSIEDPNPKKMVAVFFGVACDRMKQFANDWVKMTKDLSGQMKWVPGHQGLDQIALQILMDLYKGYEGVLPLNENIWSSEHDSLDHWRYLVKKYAKEVRVLHFKGRRWRDKDLVKEFVGIVNGG